MKLKVAVYNVEWMTRLFDSSGSLKTTGPEAARGAKLADVVDKMSPDILGIVEGPDTTVSGSKSASKQVEKWASAHGLHSSYKAVHGLPSPGQQELCAMYRSDKVKVAFKPEKSKSKNPFNEQFLVDTSDSLIKEAYKHYRAPLELQVLTLTSPPKEVARVIIAHTKSKGIFESVDIARFEQLSERNRKKLYAECLSIRERCDQWLVDEPKRNVVVMGDINDGAGMDYYERRFARSAVELLMGDPWVPEVLMKHVLPKPKIGSKGWVPYSSDFRDRLTEFTVNVLIDHIIVSCHTKVSDAVVWNPYLKTNSDRDDIQAVKKQLDEASDHYPVMAIFDMAAIST
jgi:endonuclease/exonuclease/phosphatase family metal-dependent hydrolase